jgi:hypothetical protein
MINRKTGGDFFQPLSFELRSQSLELRNAPPTDVYTEAFGAKPNLRPILGSDDVVRRVLERTPKSGESKAASPR